MGRLNRRRGERGYILLDVLVALFILLLGLAVFLGGMSVAARAITRQSERVLRLIEERNSLAREHKILYKQE